MGLTFTASDKSANAPAIEEGIYSAKFIGVTAKTIEKSQYDPNVYVWLFGLLDDEGNAIYSEGDPEPLTIDKVTSQSTNVKSKTTPGAIKVLKALMTVAEFALFETGEGATKDEDLIGRRVKVSVVTKENGWPSIEDVLPDRKANK
jgi:hypothetical protein